MNNISIEGTYTALITPFEDNHIHWPSLEKLLSHQLSSKIDGLVVLGTTGETPTLTDHEQSELLNFIVRFVAGRIPVIAGATSNSTPTAISLAQRAEAQGANMLLCATPYYNKPTQEGLFQHFCAIAESTSLPIILYCNPPRCNVTIECDTICRLRDAYPQFVALKECGGSCSRVAQLHHRLGSDFSILSGDDPMILPYMSVGAKGVVSIASNVFPREISSIVSLALANDFNSAKKDHQLLLEIYDALFCETNPIPVKAALYKMGMISTPEMRLPLVELSECNHSKLDKALEHFKQCV